MPSYQPHPAIVAASGELELKRCVGPKRYTKAIELWQTDTGQTVLVVTSWDKEARRWYVNAYECTKSATVIEEEEKGAINFKVL